MYRDTLFNYRNLTVDIKWFCAQIAWRLTCTVWRLHFTIERLDKVTAAHCKRRTSTRTSCNGCPKLFWTPQKLHNNWRSSTGDVVWRHYRCHSTVIYLTTLYTKFVSLQFTVDDWNGGTNMWSRYRNVCAKWREISVFPKGIIIIIIFPFHFQIIKWIFSNNILLSSYRFLTNRYWPSTDL